MSETDCCVDVNVWYPPFYNSAEDREEGVKTAFDPRRVVFENGIVLTTGIESFARRRDLQTGRDGATEDITPRLLCELIGTPVAWLEGYSDAWPTMCEALMDSDLIDGGKPFIKIDYQDECGAYEFCLDKDGAPFDFQVLGGVADDLVVHAIENYVSWKSL